MVLTQRLDWILELFSNDSLVMHAHSFHGKLWNFQDEAAAQGGCKTLLLSSLQDTARPILPWGQSSLTDIFRGDLKIGFTAGGIMESAGIFAFRVTSRFFGEMQFG